MNYKMIGHTLGIILMFEAGFLMLPALTGLIYSEWAVSLAFVICGAICLLTGFGLSFKKPQNTALYSRDGLVIVSLCWIVISLFGALPFVLTGAIPNYLDALFETVSGFSTTGASILSDVEALPHGVNIWRCFTHWVGGMGVLVFVMAILPSSGAHSMHIMRAESPGPSVSKLVPRVRKTALILYLIYFTFTLLEFIFLLPSLGVFDAACTAFATAGTGGFGVYNDSLASFSPYVKIVVTAFLFIFSINFNSYYLILKLKFKDAFNSEVKAFLLIVLIAISAITLNVYLSGAVGGETLGEALLNSVFTVASTVSTAGFSIVNYDLWPTISKTLIVCLMFIGACAGSTGGGFKVSRINILVKGMSRELSTVIRPNQIKKITLDRRPVEHEVIRSVNAYLVTYVLIFASSFILLSFDGYANGYNDMVTNFTAVTSAINNIGPGLEAVGPTQNFAFFSPLSKIVLIFDMLLGRLELFPMLLLFSPSTWKK